MSRGPRILLAAAALLAAACAHGEIRDGVYHAPKGRYTIALPPGSWDRLDIDGADLAIAPPDRSLSILASAHCGRTRRAPLDILSRSLFLGLADRRVREDGPVKLPAGEAYRIVLDGRMNGTAIGAEAYTLRRERCLFDFVYLAAPDRFASEVEAFRTMVRTLRLPGDRSP